MADLGNRGRGVEEAVEVVAEAVDLIGEPMADRDDTRRSSVAPNNLTRASRFAT